MESIAGGLPVSQDVAYVILLVGLFVIPRALLRWKIPTAITAFALGVVAGLGLGWFDNDATVNVLATLGIVALFLFAGLEVDFRELRRGAGVLVQHVIVRLILIAALTFGVQNVFLLELRPAILVALALATPSTGFILDSLDALGSTPQEKFWIRSKAIAVEMVALGVLFVDLRSDSWQNLAVSSAALVAMVALLPVAFGVFAKWVVPFAPKSDFSFLVILAVICAFVTKNLGVYYLVGAFIVGIAAHRFQVKMPSMRDDRMLHAVEAMASLFVPFYFFHAGLELRREDFSWMALLIALLFLIVVIPFRLLVVGMHRRLVLKEPLRQGLRVSVPMLPTLVFTLVLASILREEFDIDSSIYGALVIYAVVNTMLPTLLQRRAPPAFDELHVATAATLGLPVSSVADAASNSQSTSSGKAAS